MTIVTDFLKTGQGLVSGTREIRNIGKKEGRKEGLFKGRKNQLDLVQVDNDKKL